MCSGLAGTLLKLTVAATFVIELPATALILAPWQPLRVIGAALQAFLQVGSTSMCLQQLIQRMLLHKLAGLAETGDSGI